MFKQFDIFRTSEGKLMTSWGYEPNIIFVRPHEVSFGRRLGNYTPSFLLYHVVKQHRINRQTYRAGYTRNGLPR